MPRLLAGDWERVIRENLRDLFGAAALVTVTAPGLDFRPCSCCGRVNTHACGTDDEISAWNLSASRRWELLRKRIAIELHREGVSGPIVLARVAQRQARGADHLHLVMVCAQPRHESSIRAWLRVYRSVHTDYGFGYVDDPFRRRASPGAPEGRTMVFESPGVIGRYLGPYLTSEQFERYLAAPDKSFRPVWIAPGLLRRTGWYVGRCKWIRQAWLLSQGIYQSGSVQTPALSRLESRWPSWWFVPAEREWVLRHSGWDGVYGSGVFGRDGGAAPHG